MPRTTAVRAAVESLKLEGVTHAFGVPGAAINPFYAELKAGGGIDHTLARHVEGASHMAEGCTRSGAGNIGVCIGTSGPAGTDMITGLYSAIADSIPILCITGQAPVAKLHKEDFQAVDIASIAKPVTKAATTDLEAAQVPGVFQQAFHLMRSGRPGPVLIDLPVDIQLTEIEFDPETYQPLPVYKPAASRAQIEKAIGFLLAAERPVIVAGGGIINADASELPVEFAELTGTPVIPTLMGWGILADDHELNAGMVGLQTSHRYGNANFGAQHNRPYVHVLVNNSYLGLIRQAQRNLDINFQVNLEFENINSPALGVYGVDHVKVVEGLGCKAIRVTEPDQLLPAFEEAKKLAAEFRVPVVVEAILERITNISMSGAGIDAVNKWEGIATEPGHAPTAIRPFVAS
ncbi:thiamine pyrophosphate-binding protein [Streptomyces sp. NPDC005151]